MKLNKSLCAVIVGLSFYSVGASASTTLRLGHNTQTTGPTGQYFEMFKKQVEADSDGELKVKIYGSSMLGTQREMLEQVTNGLLDMAKVDTSMIENIEPIYKAVNYPFVWNSTESMYDVLSGNLGDQLLKSTQSRGFTGLSFYLMTPRGYYSPKPINSPKDLQGMKLRVQESTTMIKLITNIGGIPTPMPYSEVFSALQQGMVDGVEGGGGSLYIARHGEVAKYYYNDQHVQMANELVISNKTWDKLSEKEKEIVRKAAKDTMKYSYTEGWIKEQAIEQKAVDEMGVTFVTPTKEQRDEMIKLVQPMYDDLQKSEPKVYEFLTQLKDAQK